MNAHKVLHLVRTITTGGLLVALTFFTPLYSQTTGEPAEPAGSDAPETDPAAQQQENTNAVQALSARFSDLAGSDENAMSLVNGLRNGTEITLAGADGGATVIQPATGKMGYGNVKIALALTQEQLASQGITDPTAEQLAAVLNGGSITVGEGESAQTMEFAGVLALRAQGMGWGKIAQEMGLKLGPVVSGRQPGDQQPEEPGENEGEEEETGEAAAALARVEQAGKPEHAGRPDHAQRPDFAGRPEHPGRPDHVGRPDFAGRPEHAGRP